MSTFMANPDEIVRKWYVIDADGKPLGRVAAKAAFLLRGKHKPLFTPHIDCGDHVVIVNCEKTVLTGNKLDQKYYRTHSGWIGGLKETKYDKLMKERPEFAMTLAVNGMLPHNKLGSKAAKRLRVYRGAEHKHAAQQPETLEL